MTTNADVQVVSCVGGIKLRVIGSSGSITQEIRQDCRAHSEMIIRFFESLKAREHDAECVGIVELDDDYRLLICPSMNAVQLERRAKWSELRRSRMSRELVEIPSDQVLKAHWRMARTDYEAFRKVTLFCLPTKRVGTVSPEAMGKQMVRDHEIEFVIVGFPCHAGLKLARDEMGFVAVDLALMDD